MRTMILKTIVGICPITQELVILDANVFDVTGHCANEEHPAEHSVVVNCHSCGEAHEIE